MINLLKGYYYWKYVIFVLRVCILFIQIPFFVFILFQFNFKNSYFYLTYWKIIEKIMEKWKELNSYITTLTPIRWPCYSMNTSFCRVSLQWFAVVSICSGFHFIFKMFSRIPEFKFVNLNEMKWSEVKENDKAFTQITYAITQQIGHFHSEFSFVHSWQFQG